MHLKDYTRPGTNGGYTLLFAVLTAAVVLGVAVFIVDVTKKQYELSVAARNSIYAFYASDSGIECAVNPTNWGSSGFSSTTGGTLSCSGVSTNLVNTGCGAVPAGIVADPVDPTGNAVRQWCAYMPLSYTADGVTTRPCAQVIITTGANSLSSNAKTTIIDARGYNACTTGTVGPDVNNSATVERALRLTQSGVW